MFAYGQTYYWRIDEVNQSPDKTINKGVVWSFTAEPYGYPIKPVSATASSTQANMGPENTINGSGLTGDLHGTEGTTMWLSGGAQPNWIQYQFDKVYKLYDLKVWNTNQLIESFIGFGAKKVTIEYSADGTTWAALDNVPEFARATGIPRLRRQYHGQLRWRHGQVRQADDQQHLGRRQSRDRPERGPVLLRPGAGPHAAAGDGRDRRRGGCRPELAAGSRGGLAQGVLRHRPGRGDERHRPAQTVTDHAFTPGCSTFGTTYYWRVDEVNTVTYPGDVWSFTTMAYAVVEDFESYNDDDNRIYDTWIDG